jgi:16S rRNA (guanine527-N7)-methyltransferase
VTNICSDRLKPLSVSHETCRRLEAYEDLLQKWQKVKNLVSPSTLGEVWERHFRDSLQLLELYPAARRWVDIGAGAGFPGMVIAIALAEKANASVHLIESDNRKCAFLREVARATNAPAIIEYGRAEEVIGRMERVDAVTARAVAPLDKLVEMARPLIDSGATALFPKGRGYRDELTRLRLPSSFRTKIAPSLTDKDAAIIIITGSGRDPIFRTS